MCICANGKTPDTLSDLDFTKEKTDSIRFNMRSLGVLIHINGFKILTCGDVTTAVLENMAQEILLKTKKKVYEK